MEISDFLIILGTAHGTNQDKLSPDGTHSEALYSRDAVSLVKGELTKRGFTVVVDMPNNRVPNGLTQELRARAAFVNSYCKKLGSSRVIYVSIHTNGIGCDGKWHDTRGWCVFTSPGETNADDLATIIWNEANNTFPHDNTYAIRADWSDKDPDFEAKYAVLTQTACPAVLTENFFKDNIKDLQYLQSREGMEAIVRVHVEGICKYIERLCQTTTLS